MLHHRDDISQVMSSTWCSPDIVFGILFREFSVCLISLFPHAPRVLIRILLKVASVYPVHHNRLIDGVLLRWSSFQQVLLSQQRPSAAMLVAGHWILVHLPDQGLFLPGYSVLLSLARGPTPGRVVVVPDLLHSY